MKESPTGLDDYPNTDYYKIDPKTILESLDQGRSDVFTPLMATPEAYKPLYSSPFTWKQSDYLKIVTALFQYTWKEMPDDWSLYNLLFYGDCQYDPVGFDIVQITYFKANGTEGYLTREVDIYPLLGEVDSGTGASFPRPLLGWKSINLGTLNVTADKALQIAEKSGGEKARLAVENVCRIDVTLIPSASDSGWLIRYSNNDAKTIFELSVDPYTGLYVPP